MNESRPSPSADNPSLFSKLLSWAAYPASAVAGLWTAKKNVEDGVYERLKIDGGLDDIRAPLLAERKAMTEGAVKNILAEQISQVQQSFLPDSLSKDKGYFQKVEQRIRDLGLEPIGKQWKFVHRSHRQNAVINGIFMSSVTLGAMLGIADSKTLEHLLRGKESSQPER